MSPSGGGQPTGPLLTAIVSAFGSFEGFQAAFTQAAVQVRLSRCHCFPVLSDIVLLLLLQLCVCV